MRVNKKGDLVDCLIAVIKLDNNNPRKRIPAISILSKIAHFPQLFFSLFFLLSVSVYFVIVLI